MFKEIIDALSNDFPETPVSIGEGMALQYFSNKPLMIFLLTALGFLLGMITGTIVEAILGIDVHFSDWSLLKVIGAFVGMVSGVILGKTLGAVTYLMIAKTIWITVLVGGVLGFVLGFTVTFLFQEITNDGIIVGGLVGMFFGVVLGLTIGVIVGILRVLNWAIQHTEVTD